MAQPTHDIRYLNRNEISGYGSSGGNVQTYQLETINVWARLDVSPDVAVDHPLRNHTEREKFCGNTVERNNIRV